MRSGFQIYTHSVFVSQPKDIARSGPNIQTIVAYRSRMPETWIEKRKTAAASAINSFLLWRVRMSACRHENVERLFRCRFFYLH